jgi:hypothetical protein
MSLKLLSKGIPNTFEIKHFLECRQCAESCPVGMTLQEWGDLQVGLTSYGVQVWCNRHKANVIHFDFRGQRIAVNATKGNQILWQNTH